MKKLYPTILASFALAATAFTAGATDPYTLTVDDASHVVVTAEGSTTPLSPAAGTNTFVINLNEDGILGNADDQCTIFVNAVDGFAIRKAIDTTDGESHDLSLPSYNSITVTYSCENAKAKDVALTTAALADLRTASAWFTIDDPTDVIIRTSYTAIDLAKSLSAGVKTAVPFIPGEENHILVQSTTDTPVYSVAVNGTNVTGSYGVYNFDVSNGDNVVITKAIPDKQVPFTITFTDPTTSSFVTSVTVDGSEVDYTASGFTVKLGSQVIIYGSDDYKFNSMKVNGSVFTTSWYGWQPIDVLNPDGVNVEFDVRAWTNYAITVKVADPKYITLRKDDPNTGDVISLTGTETAFSVREDTEKLCIRATGLAPIEKVKATPSGSVTGPDVFQSYNISNLSDGMVIEVTTGEPAKDNVIIIYFDSPAKASIQELGLYGYQLTHRGVSTNYTLEAGYNEVTYTETGYPLEFLIKGDMDSDAPNRFMFIDNELQDASYCYNIPEVAGSVVKMYMTSVRPQFGKVTISVDDENLMPTVGVDRINTVEANISGSIEEDGLYYVTTHTFDALPGTEIVLTPAAEAAEGYRTVTVNGDEVAANADGRYVITAKGDTDIRIDAKKQSALGITEAAAAPAAIYNLQGLRVQTARENLAPGLYIIDGRKTLVN